MKLLFDANLSPSLVAHLHSHYPGSIHVRDVGLRAGSDAQVWEHAKAEGFVIVSKDNDFRQYAFLYGPPPKVVWLSVGNAGTSAIAGLMRAHIELLRTFELDPEQSLLVLEAETLGSNST